MGASDWAGRMIDQMEDEFGVSSERAVRVTDLVRWMVSSHDFEHLRDSGLIDEKFNELFITNLIESLNARKGESIEERWNTLVREFGLYDATGDDVLLSPPDDCLGHQISQSEWSTQAMQSKPDSANVWTYYFSPEGHAGWINMDSGETSTTKQRPGKPPEDGDGYGNWLAGWTSPPDSFQILSQGQMLEVQLGDRPPELAVVMNSSADGVSIRTEYPDHLLASYESVTVRAVENRDSNHSVDVPEWAEPYRNS